ETAIRAKIRRTALATSPILVAASCPTICRDPTRARSSARSTLGRTPAAASWTAEKPACGPKVLPSACRLARRRPAPASTRALEPNDSERAALEGQANLDPALAASLRKAHGQCLGIANFRALIEHVAVAGTERHRRIAGRHLDRARATIDALRRARAGGGRRRRIIGRALSRREREESAAVARARRIQVAAVAQVEPELREVADRRGVRHLP